MESRWTNKYAIIRDLSVAQGRRVPARIEGSIGVTEKPPVLNLEEDTEEEFFQECTGDGEFHDKPDLGMIKQMLDLVRDIEASSDIDDGDTQKIVEISKFNPSCEEFVPAERGGGDCKEEKVVETCSENPSVDIKKPKKTRKHRNVALMSLLESLENKASDEDRLPENVTEESSLEKIYENCAASDNSYKQKEPIKLLKPNDFITNPNITESIDKVNGWLESPEHQQKSKRTPITVLPIDMFKKKSKPVLENSSMFKRKADKIAIKTPDAELLNKQQNISYVPSTLADEYYQKYVERSKLQEVTKADIWESVEKKMKEIDAKRMQKEAPSPTFTLDLDESTGSSDKQAMDLIILPQHRHELSEDCVVCQVMCSKETPEKCPTTVKDTCTDSKID